MGERIWQTSTKKTAGRRTVFQENQEERYVYVDKTRHRLGVGNHGDQYNYLSRPRRFGKSLLVDTLEAYFRGRKELFEGLKIMDMEDDWKQYPVIRPRYEPWRSQR